MPGGFQFGWELSGSGWATCRIADGTAEEKHFVSYCTDALSDLIHGVGGGGWRPPPRPPPLSSESHSTSNPPR